jgi:hypothetical protein
MLKFVTLSAAAALALALTASQPAIAGGNGGAIAAGVVGGLAVGAIIGSQANRGGYYGGGPGYYEQGYAPVYSNCRTEREQVVDQYGRYHTRRIRVCD